MNVPEFSMPASDAGQTTPTGLRHESLQSGTGRSPGPRDTVTVHYAGWLTNGTLFDASYTRGQPISFPLDGVISGWTEGLQLMKAGGVSRFVLPPDLAYGSRGAPPVIGPDQTLVFHVELLKVG